MQTVDLIDKKRLGQALTREELAFLVGGFTAGRIPDYQMAAFLMAVCCRGMTNEETAALTSEMLHSGEQLDLSAFGDRSADKHSTGGVGDVTTLIVAPLVAAAGGVMAKMSGRGLGFTGGTVDKLAAIPGYRLTLSPADFLRQAGQVGCAVVAQSGELAPADKAIYALRDVTATVESIPLIAASIMSKKLAAGARNLVLDVKVGAGAFMKTEAEARQLAHTMQAIGRAFGRRVRVVLTEMNGPLGAAAGNALEVAEALAVLKGGGAPALRQVSLALAAELIGMALALPPEQAAAKAEALLQSGAALEAFERWVAAQGGDPAIVQNEALLPAAPYRREVTLPQSGYFAGANALAVGRAACLLGAGRLTKDQPVSPGAGVRLLVQPGEPCRAGQPVACLFTDRAALLPEAERLLAGAFTVTSAPPPPRQPVLAVLREDDLA